MNEKRNFIRSWMCNVSVASVIVGGFQENLPVKWRVVALFFAGVAFLIGLYLSKGGK